MTLEYVIKQERKLEAEEVTKEVCKKMLARNMAIEDVAACTGLSEKQIEEIKKENWTMVKHGSFLIIVNFQEK